MPRFSGFPAEDATAFDNKLDDAAGPGR